MADRERLKKKPENSLTTYDEFPYESYPFSYTRPEHLHTIGTLFGMKPAPVSSARILELGGASGGNVINFAANYPDSYTLSIDLSKVEIEHGLKRVKDLKLKNIELKAMSITDLEESAGKFDYIICHGVFSWVPDFVKDKILEISKKFLSPSGIAFISYNTLPGWNMVNNIRDMMLFHADLFQDTRSKVEQAKLFLNFVSDALAESKAPYARFLRENTDSLMKYEDAYLRHEYLAEENKQYYFYEFMELAKAKGLNYLGEANFHTMFLGNLPEKAVEKLATIPDIIRTEQYMDFIQNKRFRCTLLCHDNITLNRNITTEVLNKFYMTATLTPEKESEEKDLQNAFESIKFYLNNSEENFMSTSSPIMKAIFYVLAENPGNPIKPTEIFKLAQKKIKELKLEDIKEEFNKNIGKLIFAGYIKIFTERPASIYKITDKPEVSLVARYLAKNSNQNKSWTVTQTNDLFPVSIYEQFIIQILDGKHTKEKIKENLLEKFTSGILTANDGDKKIDDPKALKNLIDGLVDETLEKFKRNYLLVG